MTIAAVGGAASGEGWALSGMSLGLATMLLSLGALTDDACFGREGSADAGGIGIARAGGAPVIQIAA